MRPVPISQAPPGRCCVPNLCRFSFKNHRQLASGGTASSFFYSYLAFPSFGQEEPPLPQEIKNEAALRTTPLVLGKGSRVDEATVTGPSVSMGDPACCSACVCALHGPAGASRCLDDHSGHSFLGAKKSLPKILLSDPSHLSYSPEGNSKSLKPPLANTTRNSVFETVTLMVKPHM